MKRPWGTAPALGLDLDGTLVDIRVRDYAAYRLACEHMGVSSMADDAYWRRRRSGCRIVDLHDDIGPVAARLLAQHFAATVEADELLALDASFTDTTSFLEAARSKGWRTVVCTLRRRAGAVRAQLRRLGIDRMVDDVVIVTTGAAGPAPKATVLAAHGPISVMIGDTEADVRSAQAAEATALAVTTGLRCREFLSELFPDHIGDSLSELTPYVERRWSGAALDSRVS